MTHITLHIPLADLLANGKQHGAEVWPDPFQNAVPCWMGDGLDTRIGKQWITEHATDQK